MTEESRREWLAVAWATLKHLPADILKIGCKAARETCDHPSKIVPTILKETEQMMAWRREASRPELPALPSPPKHIMERDRSRFTAADWQELSAYLEKMNSPVRYREDGSRCLVGDHSEPRQ